MNEKEFENSSFDELMTELEEIVESLESGDIELEQALDIFEKGIRQTRELSRRLKDAEDRIKKVVKESDGTVSLEEFGESDVDA